MIRTSLVGLVAACVLTMVPSTVAAPLAFPQSPVGKRAAAYISAFNSGNETVMWKFEEEHRASSAMKRGSTRDRVDHFRELHKQYGKLTPQRIIDQDDDNLVLATTSETGHAWYLGFEAEAEEPRRLTGVRFDGPLDPRRVARFEQPLSPKIRKRVIDRAANELVSNYVFEDVAKRMAAHVRDRLAKGGYDHIENPYAFARQLTKDFRGICHDKHLRVRPRAPVKRQTAAEQVSTGPRPAGADNFGFVSVETLAGNVGYIKLNGFSGSPNAETTAAAAMAFVANTDALIFDLRDNGGGSPNMIVLLSGYLFDSPVHLNSFHNRVEGSVRDTYSAAEVPGQGYGQDKPVYVLTSGYTFSAAEEFTYNLKHLGRATIVGETTGGGAHPVTRHTINKYFSMSVPYARAVNPVTGTNWEGVGVIPHVKVSAEQARDHAHELALQRITSQRQDTATNAVSQQ